MANLSRGHRAQVRPPPAPEETAPLLCEVRRPIGRPAVEKLNAGCPALEPAAIACLVSSTAGGAMSP
jgi:hypothetical protein